MNGIHQVNEKILYLMHVDWHWIKQRPHFLAEELSANFDVLVVYPRANRRSHLVKNNTALLRVPIWSLPFSRFKAISFLNNCIRHLYYLVLVLVYRPSVVWFTFPTLFPQIGLRLLRNKVIVYDCMDDAPEFKSNETDRQHILHKERCLLGCADIILVTSENLRNKLLVRGAAAAKVALVRNAFGGAICAVTTSAGVKEKPKGVFRILFVGAIGDHLDFEPILHCISRIENVEFHFFGPATIDVPTHERLKFYGAIEHANLAVSVQQFDCFVMPFVVNELTQGVDPVKLYEYINFNKNIICPYYTEIDRFSEFVFFYKDKDEFLNVVKILIENNQLKYDAHQRQLFIENNSWGLRSAAVTKQIYKLLAAPPEGDWTNIKERVD